MTADLNDRVDFDNADRGLIATIEPMVIEAQDGHVVFEMDSWKFLADECPDTAHPSLWRQGRLIPHGLFEVCPDLPGPRLRPVEHDVIEGERGVIVIDPLISAETAAAALALYREHRGERPVTR